MTKRRQKIAYDTRKLIRRAYGEVVTRAARLASFAVTPLLPQGLRTIEDRQNELAADDLVVFALNLRRLIELTAHRDLASNAMIPAMKGEEVNEVAVWEAVNKIIHHHELSIMRRKSDYLPPPELTTEGYKEWMEASRIGYHPMIVVQSDRGGVVGMRVLEFTAAACIKVLNPIVSYCENDEFWLEDQFDPD